MTMSERARRRAAVFRALRPFLSDAKLMDSLWLWEEHFAAGAAFRLHEFLKRVCDTPVLADMRKHMYLSLVTHMSMRPAELGEDPWPLMDAHRRAVGTPSAAPSPPGRSDPSTTVFAYMVTRFLEELRDRNPEYAMRVRSYVVTRLSELELGNRAVSAIVAWLTGTRPAPGVALGEENMRAIVHALYVLACEYFGPVPTDQALSAAVRAAEELEPARRFPPRRLL